MSTLDAHCLYLHALTPLHVGVGQAAAIVDLPVARETATGWPVVPGSSLKGVLRDQYEGARSAEEADELFGSQARASAVTFTDLRILCLPVRSFHGSFAWVTSRLALDRFVRDAKALGVDPGFAAPAPGDTTLLAGAALVQGQETKVYLEDLDLPARRDASAGAIAQAIAGTALAAGAESFLDRFAIVPDNVFDFLCETGTEIAARIRLGEDGTTSGSGGNLWYEETVPAEALFSGFLVSTGRSAAGASSLLEMLGEGTMVQIGGDAGIGRGLCRLVVKR
jgi:CRISPR-associated protein Cmr4